MYFILPTPPPLYVSFCDTHPPLEYFIGKNRAYAHLDAQPDPPHI